MAGKVAGYGKPGRAAADHCHCSSAGLRDSFVGKPGIPIKIGHKAFELSDIDMCALFAKDTIALALALVATYSAAYGRQIAAAVYDAHCITEIAFGKFGDPIRYIVAHRATFFTRRHLAVKTPLGFTNSLREGV